jgi:hypothetical protein
MKTDLITSITATIIGVIAAYFICNMVLPAIEKVDFYVLDSSTTYTLDDPDPEIFNYRAINPTVEVYVGQCAEYNERGECIENIEYVEDEDIVLEDVEDNTNKQDNQTEVNEETQNGTSN